MLDSLSSAVSGLDAFQQQMDIIGNNIANINTTGFKDATGNLGTSFSDTLQSATSGTGSNSISTDPMQVGTGVTTDAITNNWSLGTINSTGVASNLAINGNGFFVVKNDATGGSGATYVTQAGNFSLDSAGHLITDTGMRVQGGTTGSTGDVTIPLTDASGSAMSSYSVNGQGAISVTYADGTTASGGQILLQSFTDPQELTSVGNNLFTWTSAAGPLAAAGAPGSTGLGTIQSGALELSNVDLSSEMANLITAQRAFEANSKMITTSDEVLQDVVNMKH